MIDFDTLTCDFENESFYSILEFAKKAGDRSAQENGGTDYADNILLQYQSMQNETALNGMMYNYGTRAFSYIGMPNDHGMIGGFLTPSPFGLRFAIPQKTENKEAAWALVRELYFPEWQERLMMETYPVGTGFSVVRSSRQSRIEQLLLIDDEYNLALREDYERLFAVIDATEVLYYPDDMVSNIVFEETQAYLAGEKTAEEVARIVQSRVSLYLSERQ